MLAVFSNRVIFLIAGIYIYLILLRYAVSEDLLRALYVLPSKSKRFSKSSVTTDGKVSLRNHFFATVNFSGSVFSDRLPRIKVTLI